MVKNITKSALAALFSTWLSIVSAVAGGDVTPQTLAQIDITNKVYTAGQVDEIVSTAATAATNYTDSATNTLSGSIAATYLPLTGGYMQGSICFPYFDNYGVEISPLHPGALSFRSTYPDYSGLDARLDLTRIPVDGVGYGTSDIAFLSDIPSTNGFFKVDREIEYSGYWRLYGVMKDDGVYKWTLGFPNNANNVFYWLPDYTEGSSETQIPGEWGYDVYLASRGYVQQQVGMAVFSSPQPSLAGWTLPEYISALTKYKYDEYNHICYRMSISNEVFVLKAVTNIDLTAAVNIAALKDYEDKVNQGLVPRSSSGQARDKILMLAPNPIEDDKRKRSVKRDLRYWENP